MLALHLIYTLGGRLAALHFRYLVRSHDAVVDGVLAVKPQACANIGEAQPRQIEHW